MKNSAIKQFWVSLVAIVTSIITFNFVSMKNKPALKQFLLSLLATTISIILTFGVSSILEHRKNELAKKGMVLTLIYDMDQTIEKLQEADSVLRVASRAQVEIVKNPDYFDSLKFDCIPAMLVGTTSFSNITENIFSSNIETFSTIGNVNFVNDVAAFYQYRSQYTALVIDFMKQELQKHQIFLSYEELLNFDFPAVFFDNSIYLYALSKCRNNCVRMMKLTEKEIKEFSEQRESFDINESSNSRIEEMMQEMSEAEDIIKEAREKYKK